MTTILNIILISSFIYAVINIIMGVLDAPAGLITTLLGFEENFLSFVEFCIGVSIMFIDSMVIIFLR